MTDNLTSFYDVIMILGVTKIQITVFQTQIFIYVVIVLDSTI